jgi:membrane protein implicated in regulation of membrane protease activity
MVLLALMAKVSARMHSRARDGGASWTLVCQNGVVAGADYAVMAVNGATLGHGGFLALR